eukprot:gene2769-12644_t
MSASGGMPRAPAPAVGDAGAPLSTARAEGTNNADKNVYVLSSKPTSMAAYLDGADIRDRSKFSVWLGKTGREKLPNNPKCNYCLTDCPTRGTCKQPQHNKSSIGLPPKPKPPAKPKKRAGPQNLPMAVQSLAHLQPAQLAARAQELSKRETQEMAKFYDMNR